MMAMSQKAGAMVAQVAKRTIHAVLCQNLAPGADGWNSRMLKQLPQEALQPLAQFLCRAPGQRRIVKFALLAKKEEIERPIGLCDVVYKAWLQVRYSLVSEWLKEYEKQAPWDAAKPGTTCLSVSVHRVFQAEIAKANSLM